MTLFDKASIFAIEKHSGYTRKNSETPYIVHPFEVSAIASTMTDDMEVLSAAILHDTVEDTNTTIEEIENNFGKRVAVLVSSETENKREWMSPEESWRIRKEESLELLKSSSDIGVKIVWLSDKLANLRAFYRLWKEKGEDAFDIFHQKDPSQQAWYYKSIVDILVELKDTCAWCELNNLVNLVFEKYL